jgi:hypothetical protein
MSGLASHCSSDPKRCGVLPRQLFMYRLCAPFALVLGKRTWTPYGLTVTALVLTLCLVLLIVMVGGVILARGHRSRRARKG